MLKKLLAILLTLCICLSVVGCSSAPETADTDWDVDTNPYSSDSDDDYDYDYDYDYDSDSDDDYSYDSDNDNDYDYDYDSNDDYDNNYNVHTHYYTYEITREATCARQGVKTYSCSCGHSYTEAISKSSYHDWEYATCTSPKKCNVCGKTEGSKKEHDYSRFNGYKCSMCNQVDPAVTSTLSQCSLELPTLPKTINYYNYSGKIQSSVLVTNITYTFEYYDDGNVILTAKFSGRKTYDSKGSGQSSACRIGWKLYDPDGNVFRTGTFSSPSVAEGESFANQEDDLIYNFEASKPGKYRLEILNVN